MENFQAIEAVQPYVFKINTPYGSGTGFQILYSPLWGIATAYHVVAHATEWGETIKLNHYASQTLITLKEHERIILPFADKDLAIIVITKTLDPKEKTKIPQTDPTLIETKRHMKQGAKIAWCGFPAVAPNELCFFAGDISAFLSKDDSYLVDGVAINGVSGGPAFYIDGNAAKICGVISAYMPNRATAETLPGLSVVRAVEPYQAMLQGLKSAAAAQQQAEAQNAQREKAEVINPAEQPPKEPEKK